MLTRLVEVLLIEALRSTPGDDAPPGLLRGLADARLAPAMQQMHRHVSRPWTVSQLARTSALSRSAFFERFHAHGRSARRVSYGSASTFSTAFSRHVGQPPSRYARAHTQ